MKKIITFLFIFSLFTVQAQEQVPELTTDRPDQTESSAVVPIQSLQIETGFVAETDKAGSIKHQTFAYNTSLLRYGLFKNFELRLGLEYLKEKIEMNGSAAMNVNGLGPLYTGFKAKLLHETGSCPEVAFLGGLILPFTASEDFKPSYTATDIRFAFSHTLSDQFSLGYNLGAEWDGETAAPAYFYSIALGIGLTESLGMFVETYGLLPGEGNAWHMLDTGFTYLVAPNFQLDLSAGIGINEVAVDHFLSFGFSYRLLRYP